MIRDGPNCQICGKAFSENNVPTFDQIIPKSQGVQGCNDNLRLACYDCNYYRHHVDHAVMDPEPEPILSERESMGLPVLELDQQMLRCSARISPLPKHPASTSLQGHIGPVSSSY
jgi:hypothetical protein